MIRQFEPRDLQEVHKIATEELQENYSSGFMMDLHSYWSKGFLVAHDFNGIHGFIAGIVLSEIHAKIIMLAVKEGSKRKRYGTMLCREFVKNCAIRGIRFVTLEVRVSNVPAIELYKKLGFEVVLKENNYYDNGEAALKMQLVL